MHPETQYVGDGEGTLSELRCGGDTTLALCAGGEGPLLWRELSMRSTPAARALLPYERALEYCALPLCLKKIEGETVLELAIANGGEEPSRKELQFVTSTRIEFKAIEVDSIVAAILHAYRGSESYLRESLESGKTANSTDVPELLERLVLRASALGASDIHFEPFENELRVRMRVGGVLEAAHSMMLTSALALSLQRRIKVLANIPPQIVAEAVEGSFSVAVDGAEIRLRVSILPTILGEKVVLRVLPSTYAASNTSEQSQLSALGMNEYQGRLFLSAISGDRGLILAAGPTGSGKSTLLYTTVGILNAPSRNILSLEDPVERIIPGVSQIEYRQNDTMKLSNLFERVLRQDPDVLMVGEIRNEATASTVVEAASTGLLVLSSIHAPTALEAVLRMKQLGQSVEAICGSVRLIASQRLLRRVCTDCAYTEAATPMLSRLLHLPPRATVVRVRGCERCASVGIAGLFAIYEMLPFVDSLQQTLLSFAQNGDLTSAKLRGIARELGMQTLGEQIRSALLDGRTTPESALRALGVSATFAGY